MTSAHRGLLYSALLGLLAHPMTVQGSNELSRISQKFPPSLSDQVATIFGLDDRERPTRIETAPWRSIGKIEPSGCTGTLVSPRLLLTAAHCVLRPGNLALIESRAYFPQLQVSTKIIEVIHSPNLILYDTSNLPLGYPYINDLALDWALVQLEDPLGDQLGYVPVSDLSHSLVFPFAVIMPGFSVDFGEGRVLGVDFSCSLQNENLAQTLYFHDCANWGSSGAPLLSKVSPDKYVVVGVNIGHRGKAKQIPMYSERNANLALRSSQFLHLFTELY